MTEKGVLLIGDGIDRELAMYETVKGRMEEGMMSKERGLID